MHPKRHPTHAPATPASPADVPHAGTPAAPPPPAAEPADPAAGERLLRLQADFDNYRKRVQRERQEFEEQACAGLICEMLPVLDHMDLGLAAAAAQPALAEGWRRIADQLRGVLEQAGVRRVDALGQPFDPRRHEAVGTRDSEDTPAGVVSHQVRPGYELGARLLRPAQVFVSRGPRTDAPEEAPRTTGEDDHGQG